MVHELKILPQYYEKVISKKKKFELRKDDRGFKVGDMLVLNEFDGDYTGRSCIAKVDYKLEGGEYGLEKEYCILSIDLKAVFSKRD